MNFGKWVTTQSEEFWGGSEEYETKEQAIEGGKKEYNGEGFWVGTMDKPVLEFPGKDFLAAYFDELFENSNEETIGDWSESWVDTVMKCPELKGFFERRMQEIKDSILQKHKYNFFMAGNIECVE